MLVSVFGCDKFKVLHTFTWVHATFMLYYSIPQHLLLLARCTHQSMPIMMTLWLEMRVPVPTVGGTHLVPFWEVCVHCYHHTAPLQWQFPRPSQTDILCCTRSLWCLGCINYKLSMCRCCFSPQQVAGMSASMSTSTQRNYWCKSLAALFSLQLVRWSSLPAVSEPASYKCII